MEEAEADARFEEIKNWFEEAMASNDDESSVNHGMRRRTPPPMRREKRRPKKRKSRARTPPWIYLIYGKIGCRTEGHRTITGWLWAHKLKREGKCLPPAKLKEIRRFYFPDEEVEEQEEDEDVLFEAEVQREERPEPEEGDDENGDELLEVEEEGDEVEELDQQPTTSAASAPVALAKQRKVPVPDLITIDEEEGEDIEEIAGPPCSSGRTSVMTLAETDPEFDVFTLDRPGTSRAMKRTATVGKTRSSPERKKPKRRGGKRTATSSSRTTKEAKIGVNKISDYFPSLRIQ